ncbi:unnamed protein product [Prorocentrum cordatum]|uniref:Glucose-methanol-choline oxidoreductase C-terminal domain-containing protein n=1 Tax=Prorocentrum cordatum TaxID=2364126 RepID=A0ABN9QSE1_9DINO|nr:unnamed protein product [Polarella glacialis]
MCFRLRDGVDTLNSRASSLLGKARIALEYALFQSGPMSMAPSQLGVFARSSGDVRAPDLQWHVQPLSLDSWEQPLHPWPALPPASATSGPPAAALCASPAPTRATRPASTRGVLSPLAARAARGPASAPPSGQRPSTPTERGPRFGVLFCARLAWPRVAARAAAPPSALRARAVAARALRKTREIAGHLDPALGAREHLPGVEVESDEDLALAAGRIGTSIFHPAGTTAMGPSGDPGAVLDGQLRVRDGRGGTIAGLRVADCGSMPRLVSGNTSLPTMALAEKAARTILAGER